ncbi:DUF1295 domain-containing protein [Candidatus Saccharibacteria bacterium]|nr:MAG: DUF1295 domain-containing protein [Candidatus Saccharibacteria bacterium]
MEISIVTAALGAIVLAYMSCWYVLARLTGRLDVVDSAWGLGFVLVAWASLAITQNVSVVTLGSAVLASLWGLRLFAHIANRNWRKHTDDHRYIELQKNWGKQANRKAFTNVFLLQGALLLTVSTPLVTIAVKAGDSLNVGMWIGWGIWLFGILFEATADYQLARFIKNRPAGSHAIMNTGLWRYSRHPNYFGEVTTWWGAGMVALSLGGWWGLVGPVVITLLITKISGIPPLEKHYADNAEYQTYAKKTSILVPLPPKP